MQETLEQMHACVDAGDVGGAVLILERHPEFGIQLHNGRMVAHAAAAKGQPDLVWYLAEHQNELMYLQDEEGNVPAHLAAKNGHVDAFLHIHEYAPSSMAIRNWDVSPEFPMGKCVSDICRENPVMAGFAGAAEAEGKDMRRKALRDLPEGMKEGVFATMANIEALVSAIPEAERLAYCARHGVTAAPSGRKIVMRVGNQDNPSPRLKS